MFLTLDDAHLFTTAFGPRTAPVLLGIGGWIGSWELWAGPFSFLSADWYTIAYDHRGAGATLAPTESITFERLVDDVFCVLDAYRVERCYLAAESAGAATAIAAALRQPERIAGLVIVDGFYFGDTPNDRDPFLAGLRSHYAATLDAFVAACVPEEDCDHIKRWGRQILDRAAPEAAIALYRTVNPIDLRPQLPGIHQPTLVLHGGADRVVPVETARWLAAALPNARLVILDGAGHVPTMTRPQAVAHEMAQFLRTVSMAPPSRGARGLSPEI